jgi:hypothetical protein
MGYFNPLEISQTLPKVLDHLETGEDVLILKHHGSGPLTLLPQTDKDLRKALLRKFASRPLHWENLVLITTNRIYDLTLNEAQDDVVAKVIAALAALQPRFPALLQWSDLPAVKTTLQRSMVDIQRYLDLSCLGCDLTRIIAAPLEQGSEYGFELLTRSFASIIEWSEALGLNPVAVKTQHIQLGYGKIIQTMDGYYILIINI